MMWGALMGRQIRTRDLKKGEPQSQELRRETTDPSRHAGRDSSPGLGSIVMVKGCLANRTCNASHPGGGWSRETQPPDV